MDKSQNSRWQPFINSSDDLLMSSISFQRKISSKIPHPSGNATACRLEELGVPRNDAHVPRGGDFIRAEGNHIKLSQGLPFVLSVNGGEILLQILEEFKVHLHQDNYPVIVYVEPGPDVSTLETGTSFTLFICGRLYLVQVLRVLRQPDTREAVRINLLSPSLGGAVCPELENVQVAPPSTGSEPFPSAEGTPYHLLRTPVHGLGSVLDPSSPSVQIPGELEPPLVMQMPIPSRTINLGLLSPNYHWPRTTSPISLSDTEPDHNVSSRRLTPQIQTAGKNFVCPLRTPDTPGQIRADSLTAQHGSLLSHASTTSIAEPQIHDNDLKMDDVQPSNVWNIVGRPNPEPHLARITQAKVSGPPESLERDSSLEPELDPKVSVVNDLTVDVCRFPFPAPIGTGRPHCDPAALLPIDRSLQDGALPVVLGQPLYPAASPLTKDKDMDCMKRSTSFERQCRLLLTVLRS